MDCRTLAEKILDGVGGRENVVSVSNCATRLRLKLKDEETADTAGIRRLRGVMGVVKNRGRYQVVIGSRADKVCEEFKELSCPEQEKKRKKNRIFTKENKRAFERTFKALFYISVIISVILKLIFLAAEMYGAKPGESSAYGAAVFAETAIVTAPFLITYQILKRFRFGPAAAIVTAVGISGIFVGVISFLGYSNELIIISESSELKEYSWLICGAAGVVALLSGAFIRIFGAAWAKKDKSEVCEIVYAPLSGAVSALSEVKTSVFSDGNFGEGAMISPETNLLISPVNGVVDGVAPAGNVITVISDGGAEIILHIGIDTANLKGRYFNVLTDEGKRVRMGEPIVEFDALGIRGEGYDLATAVVVANPEKYSEIKVADGFVSEQRPFLMLRYAELPPFAVDKRQKM
ncbi:MAG: hypothetical protein EGR16_07205 [Clostridiales bacterium]|nr:hypothetical protein [Clostridiales bacterium]